MGVKSKAVVAIIVLLLFLGSLWLQGGLDYHWDTCLKSYSQLNKLHEAHHLSSSNESGVDDDSLDLHHCPGQKFQVALLHTHLLAAQEPPSDVLLQPYLASWDELVKFMEALGPMVGLISNEIQTKTTIIRQLALMSKRSPDAEFGSNKDAVNSLSAEVDELDALGSSPHSGAYQSVRSMIQAEVSQGLVNFQRQTDSGCRTLLRLHRALLWLESFLEKLAETPEAGRLRSPSDLCREAYQSTLAKHHSWLVRKGAELAFIAMPERAFFYRLVCVQSQEEFSVLLNKVVKGIGEVYDMTQVALEDNNMLDLP